MIFVVLGLLKSVCLTPGSSNQMASSRAGSVPTFRDAEESHSLLFRRAPLR